LSIDTCKPRVAEECLRLGARIVNDITGLRDSRMIAAAQKYNAGVVIMHMRGKPKTMQQDIHYDDIVAHVKIFLGQQADRARQAGLREIILDPGLGFGKTAEHNLQILKRLREFKSLGYPIMIGPSRKSFLAKICGDGEARDRLEGTLAAIAVSVMNGADIVRVHDVEACRKALALLDAVRFA
jgi:dihydropteroate synthase